MEIKSKRMQKIMNDKKDAIMLSKFVLMNKPPEQSVKDALESVVQKFGYSNWRIPYQYVIQDRGSDPDFEKWWDENKQKQPKEKSTV